MAKRKLSIGCQKLEFISDYISNNEYKCKRVKFTEEDPQNNNLNFISRIEKEQRIDSFEEEISFADLVLGHTYY